MIRSAPAISDLAVGKPAASRPALVLPTDKLIAVPGLSRARLRLRLGQLARVGLILIARRPSKPPFVQVPLAL